MADHKMRGISDEPIKALSHRYSQLEAQENPSMQVSAFVRVFLLIGPEGGARFEAIITFIKAQTWQSQITLR